jgi:putative transposase
MELRERLASPRTRHRERAKVAEAVEAIPEETGTAAWITVTIEERTFAWLGRYRRNSRDYEWHTESSESMLKISSIHRMLRILKPNESKKGPPFKYRELQGNITG